MGGHHNSEMVTFLETVTESAHKWAARNVRDGFPHFNNWQYCYIVAQRYWPHLAVEMAACRDLVKAGETSGALKGRMVDAWRAVCRELRRERAYGY